MRCRGRGHHVRCAVESPRGQFVAGTYFGGTSYDYPGAVAADTGGSVYLASSVASTDFPGLQNAGVIPVTLAVSRLYISDPTKMDAPCLTQAIQNAANFANTPLAPGELVTLRGFGIGPSTGTATQTQSSGLVSTQLDGAQVFFNGLPAPLLYAQSEQINVQVPWELTGATTAQIQVEYQGALSNPAKVTIQPSSPALFQIVPASPPANPPFQGAILNQDGTVNSPSNPAARGSIVSLFGTGGGVTATGGVTGGITPLSPLDYLTLPVVVQIGRYQADVVYAGAAPALISGVFQINIVVPETAVSGNGVFLRIGGVGTNYFSSPRADPGVVTIAVK